jgi:intracellular sulfur oxidation DsrE/DsrF family protein
MYAKYPLGRMDDVEMRPNDLSVRSVWEAMKHNPMATTVKSVTDQGASFFVCNNALSGLAYELVTQMAPTGTAPTREQVVAVHADLIRHFLPGTMLVPAGVAALVAAQEARFTFLP